MTTRTKRTVCLAMTVIGPIGADVLFTKPSIAHHSRKSFRELLGFSVHSLFQSIELGTLKTMNSMFTTVEYCLQWLGMEFPNPESLCTDRGSQTIRSWKEETQKLTTDIIQISKDLEFSKQHCKELTKEVDFLRRQCACYSETGSSILEQDREQLQSLLSDKCKLIEANQNLERRISSLSELLNFATAQHSRTNSEIDDPPYSNWDQNSIGEELMTEDDTVLDTSLSQQNSVVDHFDKTLS
eukprot:g4497.t1